MQSIPTVRLAVLASGSGTTLQNFIDRIRDGSLPAKIEVVISDKEGCYALERAKLNGIDAVVLPWKDYRTPQAFSDAMYDVLSRYRIDLITLAGFLKQIVVNADYRNRIMNIHPALIPAFCGKGFYGHAVHEAVIDSGVKVSGCTVHFVDDDYDHGPIILQRTVSVLKNDTPDTLAARVFEQECLAYPQAIRLFAAGCLEPRDGRVVASALPPEYAALGSQQYMLSIVMPVYNEKATIRASVQRVLEVDLPKEILIVDDGSTDGTSQELDQLAQEFGVRVFHMPKNQGKGAAVREGYKHAAGDIVVVQDADLEYDPQELRELIEPIKRGFADVVYGSRLNGGKAQRVYLYSHFVANKFLSFFLDSLFNTTLTDMETCYKVMTRRVIQMLNLKSNGFEIEAEISAKVFKNKFRVYEMPISYYGRTYSEGKKIRWSDGFMAVWTLLKYRFFD